MSNEMKGPVWEPEFESIKEYWFARLGADAKKFIFDDHDLIDRLYCEAGRIFHTEQEAKDRQRQQGRWVPFAEAVKPEEVVPGVYFSAHSKGVSIALLTEHMDLKGLVSRDDLFPFSPSGFLAAEAKSEELKLNANQPEPNT